MGYHDTLVSDFRDSRFQQAFKQYFSELQLQVKDWDGLFAEMDGEGGNQAFVRAAAGGPVIGFIQFKPIAFTSWFFEGACGFIREFWVAEEYRGMGHGSALLGLAEKHFLESGLYTAILTADTAGGFYEARGYRKALGCKAKNKMDVFVKQLGGG
ncbi:MAG: GNAT family N-acetyltransferase [Oscillospiraceae bacterium]|jgi:GNAT superfamily N-acetyltransferase|nr:GNAT family N-acetyltransferase [Oscillospiraceae bacterium]